MYIYIYIYILNRWKEGVLWVCLNKDKVNENARNLSLYAFSFCHHIYMPIKRETRKVLLPNKNHV